MRTFLFSPRFQAPELLDVDSEGGASPCICSGSHFFRSFPLRWLRGGNQEQAGEGEEPGWVLVAGADSPQVPSWFPRKHFSLVYKRVLCGHRLSSGPGTSACLVGLGWSCSLLEPHVSNL